MSLNSNIQTIVNTLYPSATFKFISDFHINQEAHKLEISSFPLIVLDNDINETNVINPNSNILANTLIRMYFLTKSSAMSNVHLTETQTNVLIESMKTIAREVYGQIYLLDKVRLGNNELGEFRMRPAFKRFSEELSGIVAEATWKENVIINWCLTSRE